MMAQADRETLIQAAVTWIRENRRTARSADITISASTPLLQEGILDSLGLVSLVAFLEKLTGNPMEELEEEDLRTLDGLCSAALRAGSASEGSTD